MNMNKDTAVALTDALTAAGVRVSPNRVGSTTVFAERFGIFLSYDGSYLQARNVWDKDERFSLGSPEQDATVLAANFVRCLRELSYQCGSI